MLISLDTETTGLDFYHGAKPFLFTICTEQDENHYWEWPVNPLTRRPTVNKKDLVEIQQWIDRAEYIAIHNSKFDYRALTTVFNDRLRWYWTKVRDTLIASHLIASNEPHDLTSLSVRYLGIRLKPYEQAVEQATKECRRLAKRDHPTWRIAAKDQPDMPSARETTWKYDMWLPRLMAAEYERPEWKTVLSDYANPDSAACLHLWRDQERRLKSRGLWSIYLERMKILPVLSDMEQTGITANRRRKLELAEEYLAEASAKASICTNIAKVYGYDLKLPKSGNNKSLTEFCFNKGGLCLPVLKTSKKTGNPSFDKGVMDQYRTTLPPRGRQLAFVRALGEKRKRETALNYLEGYERYWLNTGKDEFYRLHPSFNSTGTDTLRMSSNNPNAQNISKQEGFNLRYCFGPAPGKYWASLDYNNIELRIPAYESEEPAMLELFEHPDRPPYFGSYHLLVFDILHPEKFREHGAKSKDVYKSTWYQWTKNGNFADLYGAVESSGTADRAFHVEGAQRKVAARLTKKAGLNRRYIQMADKYGYVETLPDRTVDPQRGYPVLCTRSEYGKILPTVPLNYHVQSTACWVMMRAMIKVHDYFRDLPDWKIIMQVHDELVVEFPAGDPLYVKRLNHVRSLMESIGDDIGVPLTCGCELHKDNWSQSEEISLQTVV